MSTDAILRLLVASMIIVLCRSNCWPQVESKDRLNSDVLKREKAITNVLRLQSRIQRIPDSFVRIRSLALLAESVCQYDKIRGRQLFQDTLADIRQTEYSAMRPEKDLQVTSGRALLVARAVACDPKILELFTNVGKDEGTRSIDAGTALASAGESIAVSDVAAAIPLLSSSAQNFAGLSQNQMIQFARTLLDVQSQSSEQADAIFGTALASLGQTNSSSISAALYALGTFLFTPAGVPMKDSIAVRPLPGGGQALVIDSYRPTASQAVIRQYLENAAHLLSGPAASTGDWLLRQSLAMQLAKHASSSAPSLVPAFEALVQQASSVAPSTRSQQQLLKDLRPGAISRVFETLEQDIEKATTPTERDRLRILQLTRFCNMQQWQEAREAALQLSSADGRSDAIQYVTFFEFIHHIKNDKMDEASHLTEQLRPGLAQAYSALHLAAAYLKDKEWDAADSWLNVAVTQTESAELKDRAHLYTAAAALASARNSDLAYTLLERAVKSFNEIDSSTTGQTKSTSKHRTLFRLTQIGLALTLEAPGRSGSDVLPNGILLSFDLSTAIARMANLDFERLYSIVDGLSADHHWAPALSTTVRAQLEAAFMPPKSR